MDNKTISEIMYDGLIIADMQGRFVYFNKKAHEMLGYSEEEFSHLSIFDVEAKEDKEATKQHIAKIIEEGVGVFDTQHKAKDGRVLDVNIRVALTEDHEEPLLAITIHHYSEDQILSKKLSQENELKAMMLDNIADSIFLHTLKGSIVYANKSAYTERGYTKEEILSLSVKDIDAPEHIKDFDKLIQRVHEGETIQFQRNHLKKDGSLLPIEVNGRMLEYDGKPYMLSITRDITERLKHEKAMKVHYDTIQKIIDSLPSLIVYSTGGELLKTNQQLLDLFSYETIEEFKAENECICDYFIEEKGYIQKKIAGKTWVQQVTELQAKKEEPLVLITNPHTQDKMTFRINLITFEDGTYLAIFDDVTNLYTQMNSLKKIAEHDPLTGAMNRVSILNTINKIGSLPYSVLFLDIDFFKKVNDTLGHEYGDTVLQDSVKVFRENIRQSDFIGRWGGEEFLIILPGASLKDSYVLAEKIRLAIEKYFKNSKIPLTVSIGIAESNNGDFDSCVNSADSMLYKAKDSGRNKVMPEVITG